MPETWNHPEMGEFKFDFERWRGALIAKDLFAFEISEDDDLPDGAIELAFMIDEDEDDEATPSEEQIQALMTAIENAAYLSSVVIDALWDDLSGEGPDSGMWWHGDLESVNENGMFDLTGGTPITDQATLHQSLSLTGLIVGGDYGPGVVSFDFSCDWEEEHGISVLIENEEVIGIGYWGDAMTFEEIAEG